MCTCQACVHAKPHTSRVPQTWRDIVHEAISISHMKRCRYRKISDLGVCIMTRVRRAGRANALRVSANRKTRRTTQAHRHQVHPAPGAPGNRYFVHRHKTRTRVVIKKERNGHHTIRNSGEIIPFISHFLVTTELWRGRTYSPNEALYTLSFRLLNSRHVETTIQICIYM